MVLRYGALAIVGTLITLAYFLMGALESYAFYGTILSGYAELTAFAVLYMLAMLALVTLLSAVFYRSQVQAILVGILSLFILMPIVDAILSAKSIEPWVTLYYASQVIGALFSGTYPPHVQPTGPGSPPVYFPTVSEAAAIMAGYVVVCLLFCALIYRRRELREV